MIPTRRPVSIVASLARTVHSRWKKNRFAASAARPFSACCAKTGWGNFIDLQSAPGFAHPLPAPPRQVAVSRRPGGGGKTSGFRGHARRAKVTLHLPAIHCVACVWLLENLFKLHPGVGESQVNFARREAAITFAPDKIKFSELAALLASIGYEPQFTLASGGSAPGSGENSQTPDARRQTLSRRTWLQIGLAGFAFGNIMIMSLPFYLGLDSLQRPVVPGAGRLVEPGAGVAGRHIQRVGFLADGVVQLAPARAGVGSAHRVRPGGNLFLQRIERAGASRAGLLRFAVRIDFLSALRPGVPEENLRPADV